MHNKYKGVLHNYSSLIVIVTVVILIQEGLPFARALPQWGVPAAAEAADSGYYSDEDDTRPKQDAKPAQVNPRPQPVYYRQYENRPQTSYYRAPEQRYQYRPEEPQRYGK